jgi:hemolysin activation/secretion protein
VLFNPLRKLIFLSIAVSFCLLITEDFPANAGDKKDEEAAGRVVFRSLIVAEAAFQTAEATPRTPEAALQIAEADPRIAEATPQTAEAAAQAEEAAPKAGDADAKAGEADAKADKEGAKADKEDAKADDAAQDEGETVLVKAITFTGNTVIATETLDSLTEEFKNQDLTWDEIKSIADSVTMAYQELGYILAKAYVPEQEIKDGVLEIRIVEGNVGKLEVKGNKYYHERVIKRYFRPQMKHGVIRERMLESALLLTKEIPSVETRVVLKKGEKPGTADMLLDTKDSAAVKLSLDYNNFGHPLTGEDRYGTKIEFTDPWWGNTLKLRGVTGNDPDDSKLGSVGLAVPVSTYGTKVLFNYMNGNYLVGRELADLGLEGKSRIYGTGLYQPFIKTGTMNLSTTAHFERKYSKSFIDGEISTLDKLNTYGLTIEFDNLDRFLGKNIAIIDYSHGRILQKHDIPLSKIKADVRFNIYRLDVARIQKIYGYTNLMVRGSGQLTPNRVVSIEQKSLGGYGSVRGHEPALQMGDAGYTITGELMFAPPLIAEKTIFGQRIAQMMQFAVFFDHGGVYTSHLKAGEIGNEYLNGFGGGIRLFYKELFRFKFDIARPIKDKYEDDKNTYYYFMIDVNFL